MDIEIVNYQFDDRNNVMEQIVLNGKKILKDVSIDLVEGELTNCYFEVVTVPPSMLNPDMA